MELSVEHIVLCEEMFCNTISLDEAPVEIKIKGNFVCIFIQCNVVAKSM